MSSPFQARRAEEKLGIILGRVGSIRSRLNSLAWQSAAFGILGSVIGCAALVLLAAYYAPPLAFLAIVVVLGASMVAGLVWSGRGAWRRHASMVRAASVADERAGLKGRLETIVEVARRHKTPGRDGSDQSPAPMWSYLIEDTLARKDEFQPAKIERRRVSRSIYALLTSLLIAAVAVPLITSAKKKALTERSARSESTLELKDLRLRPADPGSQNGLEVHADARTMRMLEEMMTSQGLGSHRGPSGSFNRLLNRARNFADKLQGKLTGRKNRRPLINLKLADASKDLNRAPANTPPSQSEESRGRKQGGRFQRGNPAATGDSHLPGGEHSRSTPGERASSGVGKPEGDPSAHGSAGDQDTSSGGKSSRGARGDRGGGSGSSHGAGADPDSLFGQRTEPRFGTKGFEIAVEARPMAQGSKAAGQAYLPPKVRTPLNPDQQPDEPIPRASVPEQDRAAIKSVFER